jgi:hypothetical protein
VQQGVWASPEKLFQSSVLASLSLWGHKSVVQLCFSAFEIELNFRQNWYILLNCCLGCGREMSVMGFGVVCRPGHLLLLPSTG